MFRGSEICLLPTSPRPPGFQNCWNCCNSNPSRPSVPSFPLSTGNQRVIYPWAAEEHWQPSSSNMVLQYPELLNSQPVCIKIHIWLFSHLLLSPKFVCSLLCHQSLQLYPTISWSILPRDFLLWLSLQGLHLVDLHKRHNGRASPYF